MKKEEALVSELLKFEFIGLEQVAHMAGSVDTGYVTQWLRGNTHYLMTGQQRQRLELILECLQTIKGWSGADEAKVWFHTARIGSDYISPYEAICRGRTREVRASMELFVNFARTRG